MKFSPPLVLDPSTFIIGYPIFDEQHKTLILTINELYSARFNGSTDDDVVKIINRLVKQTISHFTDEEAEMLNADYPRYQDHVIEHRKLLEDAEKFVKRYENGEDIAEELQKFLFDWLSSHIRESDQDFVKFSRHAQ